MLSNRDAVVLLGHDVERDLLQRRVHVDRRSAQLQFDVVVGVEALAVHADAPASGIAAQVVLRQPRTLVAALPLACTTRSGTRSRLKCCIFCTT
jgi:hypothetical protein